MQGARRAATETDPVRAAKGRTARDNPAALRGPILRRPAKRGPGGYENPPGNPYGFVGWGGNGLGRDREFQGLMPWG